MRTKARFGSAASAISACLAIASTLALAPTAAIMGGAPAEDRGALTVQKKGDTVVVDTGPMRLEIDTGRLGFISQVTVGEKLLVGSSESPPLTGVLLQSPENDGFTDFVGGRFIPAEYTFERCSYEHTADRFVGTTVGALKWPEGDRLRFTLTFSAAMGSTLLHVRIEIRQSGAFENRYLRRLALEVPLALRRRKRIIQAGDRGARFDTRHVYDFHGQSSDRFLPYPDHNEWQHFYVDQCSPLDYHLWRSESLATSGLSMFRGRQAAGWMTAYDREGGVLFGYRDASSRAPKRLYFHAAGAGRACVELIAPSHRALSLNDPVGSGAILGAPHETDWVFFEGEPREEEPEVELASVWGKPDVLCRGPVRADPVLARAADWEAKSAAGELVLLIAGGVPLPRGALKNPTNVRVFGDRGQLPRQTRPLAFWPDGSVKWLFLIFPANGPVIHLPPRTAPPCKVLPFTVTRRGQEGHAYRLLYGPYVRPRRARRPLAATEEGGLIAIDTGPLELTIAAGRAWLKSVRLHGQEMLRPSEDAVCFVDFLPTETAYPVGTTHPPGQRDPGPITFDKIALEESGPLRAVVRLEGQAECKEPPRVILRLEAYAGRSFIRVYHTVEFRQKDPRKAFVRSMGLRLPLAIGRFGKCTIGGQAGPLSLGPARRTGLLQASHLHYSVWQQSGGQSFRTVQQQGHRSHGWLHLGGETGGLAALVRNAWQESPKEIVADAERSVVTVYLWPESGPLMDVRRYSNFPHRAQGETCRPNHHWVDETYYPNDPFAGVAKSHELLLLFDDGSTTGQQFDSLAADFARPPLVHAGADWFAETAVTLPHLDPQGRRHTMARQNLANLARFWQFHQRFWGWYGFWDYGDLRHLFGTGYGKVLSPEDLAFVLGLQPGERTRKLLRRFRARQDYFPPHDWAFDNGRWGWGNTEGMPGLFMQLQYLTSGDRDLYFLTEALARHSLDVDMRHAGKWFGRGTRHGVQHWSDGHHGERQTCHSEFRFYHYLSGDMRCRDFAKEIAEKYYLQEDCPKKDAHAARLYGLLTYWEMTGERRVGDALRRYVHALTAPEGLYGDCHVAFPEIKRTNDQGLNTTSMFWKWFGAMHALIEYHQLTGDARARDAIIRYADVPNTSKLALAFAIRHAPDPPKYRKALVDTLLKNRDAYRTAYRIVSSDPARWTGPGAFFVGNVPMGLFWVNEEGYVMSALGEEPALSEEQLSELEPKDESPRSKAPASPRGSWEDEYDRPEFSDYLRLRRELEP